MNYLVDFFRSGDSGGVLHQDLVVCAPQCSSRWQGCSRMLHPVGWQWSCKIHHQDIVGHNNRRAAARMGKQVMAQWFEWEDVQNETFCWTNGDTWSPHSAVTWHRAVTICRGQGHLSHLSLHAEWWIFLREQRLQLHLRALHHPPQWWPMPPLRWSCWRDSMQQSLGCRKCSPVFSDRSPVVQQVADLLRLRSHS